MAMRVAYLACAACMTGAPVRRIDAYEHDRELAAFAPAFARHGIALEEVEWRTLDLSAHDFDLMWIRTTWDYTDHPEEFAAFLERAGPIVENAPALVRWNMSKHYLRELADAGLPVIASAFVAPGGETIDALRDALGAREIILKPVYGGGGFGQRRVAAEESGAEIVPEGVFAQPFVPEIQTEGEVSFIYVDGAFSHCVRKSAAPGGYLVHAYHGGAEHAFAPDAALIAAADAFVAMLPATPLACRIDLVPTARGPLLMELEVIEPHLFPHYAPDELGDRLARACLGRRR